jgi:hypothetical protein
MSPIDRPDDPDDIPPELPDPEKPPEPDRPGPRWTRPTVDVSADGYAAAGGDPPSGKAPVDLSSVSDAATSELRTDDRGRDTVLDDSISTMSISSSCIDVDDSHNLRENVIEHTGSRDSLPLNAVECGRSTVDFAFDSSDILVDRSADAKRSMYLSKRIDAADAVGGYVNDDDADSGRASDIELQDPEPLPEFGEDGLRPPNPEVDIEYAERFLVHEWIGLQSRKSGRFDGVIQGSHPDRASMYLYTIDHRGVNLIREQTPFPTSRGCVVHTNVSTEAHIGGEAWFESDTSVWINRKSGRFGINAPMSAWHKTIAYWESLGYEVNYDPDERYE